MPRKKRDVHQFMTRLKPELVRKLDAYAVQADLSRNQAIERLLERCFLLSGEVRELRRIVEDLRTRDGGADDPVQVLADTEESIEFRRMEAAEKLAKPRFFEAADGAAPGKRGRAQ
ncbi:MAG TPA: hypothetical protein VGP72_00325 [Planctomycetota bacterium]